MTSTEAYTDAADTARTAVERSADLWKQSVGSMTEQFERMWHLPEGNPVDDFTRQYFEYLHEGIEVNKAATMKWVAALASINDALRDQLQAVTDLRRGHIEAISTWISGESETIETAAKQQAEQIEKARREQIERAQQAGREREEQARQSERDQARRVRLKARERYEHLTKVELSEQLAERGLPKTGTVDELVDRLVSADSN